MRICLFTHTALPKLGGQELVVDALARQFLELGHDPFVLAPYPKRLRLDDARLPYPVVRHPRFYSTRYFVGWYRHWLLKLSRTAHFDVLHCHTVYPNGYLAALCAGSLFVPTVITSHGGDVREGNVRLVKPVIYQRCVQAVQSADALVAISRFTYDGFLRICPQARHIVSIPNGVDLEQLTRNVARPRELDPAIETGRYALFLGRLHRRKGVDVLLDALARVPGAGMQLVIAGDGDERSALEAQADRLALVDRIRFVGAVTGDSKAWLLQNSSFVVMPSRNWESFGLVVLESYAAGRPVIATRLPGMADLVEPERTGLLVAPDAPAELAVALARLYANPHQVQRMGQAARQVVEDYTWRAVAVKHLELFQWLRGQRTAARAA